MTKLLAQQALLPFIETYQALPELWDVNHPLYSNRSAKDAAYDKLVKKIKVIEPDATRRSVARRIGILRSCFRRELKKALRSKKSGSIAYEPTLWYYQKLMFLVDQETAEAANECSSMEPMEDEYKCEEDPLLEAPIKTSVESEIRSTSLFFPQIKKRRKPGFSPVTTQETCKSRTECVLQKEDECATLARGYAIKLRKLAPSQLMFADKIINDVLLDAQLGLLGRKSILTHPEPPVPLRTSKRRNIQTKHDESAEESHNSNDKAALRAQIDDLILTLYPELHDKMNGTDSTDEGIMYA